MAGSEGELEGASGPHPLAGPRGAAPVLRPGQRPRHDAGIMLRHRGERLTGCGTRIFMYRVTHNVFLQVLLS